MQADRLEFTYTVKASEEWLRAHSDDKTDPIVTNEARIGDEKDPDRWDAKSEVPYFPPRLTKKAEQVTEKNGEYTTNLLKFTLHVNPLGINLDPDQDYLIVRDTSEGIEIKPETITVLNDKTGGNALIEKLPADTGQFRLKVPDDTPLTITYEALVTSLGDVHVSNKASVEGVERTEDGYDELLKVDKMYADGGASKYGMTIRKVDSTNSAKNLAGAKFKFYVIIPSKESGGSDSGESGSGGSSSEGGGSGDGSLTANTTVGKDPNKYPAYTEKEWTFTIGTDGTFYLDPDTYRWRLYPGSYYALEEIEAPEGYEKLEDPIIFYYGLESDENRKIYPETKRVVPNGSLTVENEPVIYELPETGGSGTAALTFAGALLILAGGTLLYRRKRIVR